MTTPAFSVVWNPDSSAAPGLEIFVQSLSERLNRSGEPVTFHEDPTRAGFRISRSPAGIQVEHARPCDAFRALGVLLSKSGAPVSEPVEEVCAFSHLGVMLDVSRNAVLRVDVAESLFRRFALMGINSVQLYMEDVYSIEGEPFFGYGRGAYSPDELRRLDEYGARLGIEVIPCIQTLAHLEQVLQWPIYEELIDVPGVLLIDEEKTYRLIEKMLDTVAACFRSRRIHVGMDEAHGVGLGRYRRLHGETRIFDLLNRHLAKVTALCTARGLRPMMWSDMYFRIGSKKNDYYDPEIRIPGDVASRIPPEVDLVYWDYYHKETSFYEEWLDRHRALGKEPVFATGGWNWGRIWTHLPAAFVRISAGMKAAREKKINEAFITLWGDDGAECDPFSTLPGIQFFAESAYHPEVSLNHLENRFHGSCAAELAPFLLGSRIDTFPDHADDETSANFGKWLLWHDPVLSFLDHCIPAGMVAHYQRLAERLEHYSPEDESAVHVGFITLLTKALAAKTEIHVKTRSLYRAGNLPELRRLMEETLPVAVDSIQRLWQLHRQIWHAWYKPFGWEVLDRRYGGILARLESLRRLLEAHLLSPGSPVPEFDFETHPIQPNIFFNYGRASFTTTWR